MTFGGTAAMRTAYLHEWEARTRENVFSCYEYAILLIVELDDFANLGWDDATYLVPSALYY